MNARSIVGVGRQRLQRLERRAMRSSMRSATPASTQASLAMAVYSSLTSQHSRRPPGRRPRAMQIDE